MTELNNRTYFVTVIDTNNFTLDGENGSNYTAFAPKTDALVKASGSTMGSIRAKTVSIDGAGGFHYDTKLGEIGNVSTCCGATKLVFKGWRYL